MLLQQKCLTPKKSLIEIFRDMTWKMTLMFMAGQFVVNNKMQELKIEKASRNIQIFRSARQQHVCPISEAK